MGAPPAAWIEGCVASHGALLATLERLDDDGPRAPSRLPGWSRGHVLTHLARNADSVVRHLEGARRGETLDQYPGGFAGRAAAIEDGAGRSASALVHDVTASARQVEAALASMPEAAWDCTVRSVRGLEYPASFVAFVRWREVETHHADLGLDYAPADWPPAMVAHWLALELPGLAARAEPGALLAWVVGRGPAPELEPW